MTSILGPYWSPWHRYPQDEDYIRRLDPAWVLIHQPQARDVSMAQRLAPSARIMLRSWDIDDSKGERKQEMYADPVGAARKHLDMWKGKWNQLIDELHKNNWPFDESRWYIQLINEPDPTYVQQMVDYSLEAMRLVQGTQIRLGLVVSSVGTFSKPSENGNGWALCTPLERPINAGGHILVAHEYWQPEGPNYGEDGGNLAWRHHSIPLDVPILIGEAGANGYIYQRYSQNDDAGWQKTVKDPNVYAAQVKEYIEGCDTRVQGVLLFMLDYHSEQWWSFHTGPAMEQLLAIRSARPQATSPFAKANSQPSTIHLPSIGAGPTEAPQAKTAYVAAPSGLNLRAEPKTDSQLLLAIPYGESVTTLGVNADTSWSNVTYNGLTGWMLSSLLTFTRPEGSGVKLVQPQPVGDKWQRTIGFVLGVEGGFNPNDEGAPANFGINQGANPDLDVAHITREQAIERYRTGYWLASGADQLEWPFCLLVMDAAVQHGPDVAKELFRQSGGDMLRFQGLRQLFYGQIREDSWQRNGRSWMNRMGNLLVEASKS